MATIKLRSEMKSKMENTLKSLEYDCKGLRTGRASIHLLDPIVVDSYGTRLPLSQVATISTPDSKTIMVQVWDKMMVKVVSKGIAEANLGLNPSSDGQLLRMIIPPLTEERRKELVKLANKYAENAKISLRNIRRDANEELKKLEKNNLIAMDEHRNLLEEIQKITTEFSNKIDNLLKQKEKDILTV